MPRRSVIALALVTALGLSAPASVAQSTKEVVTTSSNAFSPAQTTVAPGDTVTFRKADGGFHNVVWDDNGVPASPPSATPIWGTTVPKRTFTTPGSFRFYCEAHGTKGGIGMSGQVIVSDPSNPQPPPVVVDLTSLKVAVKQGVATLRARATVSGKITVVLKRKRGGRFIAGGSISKTVGQAGPVSISLRRVGGAKPGPGSYLAELRLKDTLGRTSPKRSVKFRILRP